MIGETVSLYQVLKMLGRGGMGRVFLAQDRSLDRKVALKFLLEDMESHVTVRQRFLKEARFAAAIDHPYVCKIYQVGEHEGKAFVAMEFVEGLTLREKLQQGLLAWSDTFRIAIQAAEALEEIHGRRLVHRDLKPSNIMLTKQGHVKIMDFGLAMEVLQSDALGSESETPQDLTSPGSMIGTVSYMSPEQARKQELDGRSDIFSFGIILYEMITGVHPFQKGTQFETASSILEEVPPPLTRYHSAIPELLQHTLSKMLAKEPERRYQSVHELRTNLSQLARTGPLEADTPSRTAVAVLPFVDMSPDGDQDYFCEGMAEELIGRLGRLEGLRVAARTSAFRFKAAELDIREIGRELNVGTVLEGSLRKSKDKLRIGVRLIDVAEGYPLWSERYDRDLGDVLEIQDEIARAVVEKLKVNFSLEDRTSARPTSKNIKAYERYLKGRYCWNNRTEASLKLSLEHFKKAIEQDPDYALAYAGMAASYATLSIYGAESPKELMPKAKSAAEKALRLDGRLALALTSLGCVRSMYEWDWEAGDQDFKQALEIEPRNEHAHHWYAAHCLMPLGRLEEACSHIKLAQEIDPLNLIVNATRGLVLYFERRYDAALKEYRRTLKLDPNYGITRFFLGQAYAQKEMYPEAIQELKRALNLDHGSPEKIAALGYVCAMAGQRDEARKRIEELNELATQRYVSPVQIAQIHAGLDEPDQALDCLEKAYQDRDTYLVWLKIRPVFDSIRFDSRFDRLCEKIGLPE